MEISEDYTRSMEWLISGLISVVFICGIMLVTKLKRGKATPSVKAHKCGNDSLHLDKPLHNIRPSTSKTGGKQCRLRSGNKQKVLKNNKNTVPHVKSNNKDHMSLTGSAVKHWLQSDGFCYERGLVSSAIEDKMMSRNAMGPRNNTSITAFGSKGFNSSSRHEDLPLEKTNRFDKRQQHSKQNRKYGSKYYYNSSLVQQMCVADDIKENAKPIGVNQISANAVPSLRKQCSKAAALQTALHSSTISRTWSQEQSYLSVKSSFSSSSTASTSSSISSSASSSPMHSVNSSPTASPTTIKRQMDHAKKRSVTPPLRQFTKLNMNEQELFQQMKRYVIDPSLLRIYGYPTESVHNEGCVDIYKCSPKHIAEEAVTKDDQRHHCQFYGRKKYNIINDSDGLSYGCSSSKGYTISPADSGHVSGESSPRFTDSDSSEMSEEDSLPPLMAFYTPDGVYQIFSEYCSSTEIKCVRCSKCFEVNEKGEYLSFDSCTYHCGKLNKVYNGKCNIFVYSCCQGEERSEGCSKYPLHVWNGVADGLNGPYTQFLHTQISETKRQKPAKVYALDCEMSYTGLGLEVTKVTVIGFDGSLVYEHFVKPQAEIVDYNTRFSGVSEKDYLPDSNNSIKTFAEVQKDLLNLFDSNTILIGHGLDNDLRVLRLVHKTVVDTSLVFSHSTGYPYRRSLRVLTKAYLKRDIQCGDMGHSSFEDSRACLELMMWKIRKDLSHWSYQ